MSTFTQLQTDIFNLAGMDANDTNSATLVQRWINVTQQDVASRWPWNFLRSREVITTIPDYTTGTVSVANGGTTVTGSGTTFTSTMVGYFIQFSGSNDWYKITAYTSATSITIETAYAGTTLSGATHTIRKFFYSLSSSADRILDIRNENTPMKLVEVDPRTLDAAAPNPSATNSPYSFCCYGYDSSGNIQITPYPFPNDARLLEIRTIKRVSDMSSSSDVSVIPTKWHHVLVAGSAAWAFMYLRKPDLATQWKSEYERIVTTMTQQGRTSEDEGFVLNSVDSGHNGVFLGYRGRGHF
jgi:hypothetical protein